jgi:hypothetical protein
LWGERICAAIIGLLLRDFYKTRVSPHVAVPRGCNRLFC